MTDENLSTGTAILIKNAEERSKLNGLIAWANVAQKLHGIMGECAEYLSDNNLNTIGAGSILHTKMRDAIKEAEALEDA